MVDLAFVAAVQAAAAGESGHSAFDGPVVPTEPGGGLDVPAGDAVPDAPLMRRLLYSMRCPCSPWPCPCLEVLVAGHGVLGHEVGNGRVIGIQAVHEQTTAAAAGEGGQVEGHSGEGVQ